MPAFLIGLYNKHIQDCLKVQIKVLMLEYFPNFYINFSTFILFWGGGRRGVQAEQFSIFPFIGDSHSSSFSFECSTSILQQNADEIFQQISLVKGNLCVISRLMCPTCLTASFLVSLCALKSERQIEAIRICFSVDLSIACSQVVKSYKCCL